MQCLKRCLFVFTGIVIACALSAAIAFWYAGVWLDRSDMPARADAIVVLADDATRALSAADLYLKGYAKEVYFTVPRVNPRARRLAEFGVNTPRSEDLFRQTLIARGVPETAIRAIGKDLVSTWAEANVVRDHFPESRTLLIVTSPYHILRTRMIFRDAMPGRTLQFVGSHHEPYPARWWTDQDAAKNVPMEFLKIAFYLFGGRF